MKIAISRARYWLLGIVLLVSVAACVPVRTGASWAALRVVGQEQKILVAYEDRLFLVDPRTRNQVELKDEDGSPLVNAENQVMKWQFTGETDAPSRFYSAPVVMDGNTLLVAAYEGKIFKLDLDNPDSPSPEQVFDGILTAGGGCSGECILADLALADSTLYVPFANRDLVSLDADDLSLNWRFATEHGIWSRPVIDGDTVYVTSMDHRLYAIDTTRVDSEAREATAKWQVDLEGAVPGSPVLYDGRLYVGSLARKVFAISTDGQKLDEYKTDGWVWSSPVVDDGILYVADLSGYVYALDVTGAKFEPVWKSRQLATMGIRPTPLVVGDQVIVASRDGRVFWLDRATGESQGDPVELGAEILSDLLLLQPSEETNITEPLVIVSTVSHDRLLVALKLQDGKEAWRYPPPA